MSEQLLEADYVLIGAGASAMSFADVILTESDRSLLIVDQNSQPGGHWNHAYPFVRLHQPSEYYGVPSRPLGRHVRDVDGVNEGLYEQATGQQVLSYFDDVMREQFLRSNRVTYLPMSEYLPGGRVISLLTGNEAPVRARRRVVDARYLGSEVPSRHTPNFVVDDGVTFMPINDLTTLTHAPAGYVVLGAGKTSVDACLWLLERGVDPDEIVWVRPRDLWLLNRARVQPDAGQLSMFADIVEAAARADGIDDLVTRLEQAEILLRIDQNHRPTTFRGATASVREIEELRRIEHVVRLGHVTRIEPTIAHLEHGDLHVGDEWVYVDCTAEGIRRQPIIPIFQPDQITLEYTMPFGVPTYSAALIARVELASDDDEVKNDACPAVPVPDDLQAIATHLLVRLEAPEKLAQLPGVTEWNDSLRLNPGSWALGAIEPDDEVAQQAVVRFFEAGGPAIENLRRLLEPVPT